MTEATVADFNENLMGLNTKMAVVETTMTHIQRDVTDQHGRIDDLTREIKDMERRIVEKLDALHRDYSSFKDEYGRASSKTSFTLGKLAATAAGALALAYILLQMASR